MSALGSAFLHTSKSGKVEKRDSSAESDPWALSFSIEGDHFDGQKVSIARLYLGLGQQNNTYDLFCMETQKDFVCFLFFQVRGDLLPSPRIFFCFSHVTCGVYGKGVWDVREVVALSPKKGWRLWLKLGYLKRPGMGRGTI